MNHFDFVKYLLDTHPIIVAKYPFMVPVMAILSDLIVVATIITPMIIIKKKRNKYRGDDDDDDEDY